LHAKARTSVKKNQNPKKKRVDHVEVKKREVRPDNKAKQEQLLRTISPTAGSSRDQWEGPAMREKRSNSSPPATQQGKGREGEVVGVQREKGPRGTPRGRAPIVEGEKRVFGDRKVRVVRSGHRHEGLSARRKHSRVSPMGKRGISTCDWWLIGDSARQEDCDSKQLQKGWPR